MDSAISRPSSVPNGAQDAWGTLRRRAVTPMRGSSRERVSRWLQRYWLWALASVLVAIALDVALRSVWPAPGFWLDLAVLGGVTLPVMLAAGAYAIPRAQRQERALWRREMRHWRQARRDPLTGAHNRLALQEFINRLRLDRPRAMAALFVLDLHEFQRINDACGHQVGDEVLREVCRRLRALAFQHRPAGAAPEPTGSPQRHPQVVRVGSDELGLWFPEWSEGQTARSVAEDMLAVLDEPFEVAGLRLHVQGVVGHVVQAIGESSGSDWLTRVNAALQEAKRQGVGRHVAFEHRHIEAMVKRHEMQQALRDAVRHGEGFSLEYQPIVSIELGTLMGCEALLRWQHPQWGQVPPSAFIPVAEGSDLIRPLGRWVLSRAIEQMGGCPNFCVQGS